MSFSTLPPKATLQPTPFTAHVSDADLAAFTQLLALSKLAPETFENRTADPKDLTHHGLPRAWLAAAKQHWQTRHDWRQTEARINSFPNFTVPISYPTAAAGGGSSSSSAPLDIHFVALFSPRRDAVPLVLLHGWPGSFLEFLGVLDVLRARYADGRAGGLPFHVVVPSLPGYGYSSGPPLDRAYGCDDVAGVVDALMVGLGFADGYVAQGGDIGSFVARRLGAAAFPACKAIHLNFCYGVDRSEDLPASTLSREEQAGLERVQHFKTCGSAYAMEHGTRPATIGLVLASSPLALLAWIGEKFLQWTDTSPPLDDILDSVTLYWFTESFPRAIYPYGQSSGPKQSRVHQEPEFYVKKPMGYSWYPKELAPIPRAWVETTGNLVWYRAHTEGGHFAAMEKPELFVKDMEDFVATLLKEGTTF